METQHLPSGTRRFLFSLSSLCRRSVVSLSRSQNEIGVVLFGLPAEETNNRLNGEDEELYQGLQEFNR